MATKQEIIAKFGKNDKDTGSTEVQIALLSARIIELTEHMRSHKKDYSTRKGLLALVSSRKKLLSYLQTENYEKFTKITTELGIRGQK